MLTALYRPVFFREVPYLLPRVYHGVDFLFDGRQERHQVLLIAKASSDEPVAGGFQTVQAGLGWGYEILRYSSFSFILRAAMGIGDFGIDLPNGGTRCRFSLSRLSGLNLRQNGLPRLLISLPAQTWM